MRIGTKSLLFGVHQFLLHPLTVLLAWRRLYGCWPDRRQAACILIHDWGYWGKPNMDGPQGERHPEWAANVVGRWWGPYYAGLCYYHSRHYARRDGAQPSKLCWADKLSITYVPWWIYLPLAWLSGELSEYRVNAACAGAVPLWASHRQWLAIIKAYFATLAREQQAHAVPYLDEKR